MNRKIIPSLMLSGCLAMTACLAIPAFPAQASQEIYHISEDDSPVEYHSPEEIRDFFHSRPFSRTQPDTFDEEPDLESETAGKLSGESVENAPNTRISSAISRGSPLTWKPATIMKIWLWQVLPL